MNVSVDSLKFEKIHKTEFKNTAELLLHNFFLKSANQPSNFIFQKEHRSPNRQQVLFYMVFFLFIMFAILKVVFNNYFNNIIKVFFNTTLRQSQLTEQLLLAKLPSLFYNVFFVVVISIYVFVLMKSFSLSLMNNRMILLYILFSVLCVYAVKYFVLQISGWLTGYKQDIDNYIFNHAKIIAKIMFNDDKFLNFSKYNIDILLQKLSPKLANQLLNRKSEAIFTRYAQGFLVNKFNSSNQPLNNLDLQNIYQLYLANNPSFNTPIQLNYNFKLE